MKLLLHNFSNFNNLFSFLPYFCDNIIRMEEKGEL